MSCRALWNGAINHGLSQRESFASIQLTIRRCPDPTKAFDALSRSLFLDQHLLRLSGSASAAGGGLAVSCAPPSVHQNEACHRWMSWLKKVHEQKDYDALVDLCVGVTPREFARRDSQGENDVKEVKNGEGSSSTRNELELVDIERDQMEDLIAMRSRPHLMPYRRYIYIGEVSLDKTTRQQYGQQVSECLFLDSKLMSRWNLSRRTISQRSLAGYVFKFRGCDICDNVCHICHTSVTCVGVLC